MSELKPKKMVSRNVAIALGIICIILVTSIVSLLIVMDNMNNTIRTDNNQINSLSSQVSNLNDVINLDDYKVPFNQSISVQAGQSVLVMPLNESYSGFLDVQMTGANLTSTWVMVSYMVLARNGEYDYQETRNLVGYFNPYYNGYVDIEDFPILQNNNGALKLGNNSTQTITEWLTVIYYY